MVPFRTLFYSISKIGLVFPILFIGIQGSVLCIGADGHVKIERSFWGSCWAGEHEVIPPPGNSFPGHRSCSEAATDCCGNCIDLSLSVDMLFPATGFERNPFYSQSFRLFTCCFSLHQNAGISGRWPPGFSSFLPLVQSSLLAQRTVVLRL